MRHMVVMALALVMSMSSTVHAKDEAKKAIPEAPRAVPGDASKTKGSEEAHKQVSGELLRVDHDLFWVITEKPSPKGGKSKKETLKFLASDNALIEKLKGLEVFDEVRVDYSDVPNNTGKLAHSVTKVEESGSGQKDP
jgi:hypothetical protein